MTDPHLSEPLRPDDVPPPAPDEGLPPPPAGSGARMIRREVQPPKDPIRQAVEDFLAMQELEGALDLPSEITVTQADGKERKLQLRSRSLGFQQLIWREYLTIAGAYDELQGADAKALAKIKDTLKALNEGDENGADLLNDEVRKAQLEAYEDYGSKRVEAYVRIIQLLVAPAGKAPDLEHPAITKDEVLWGLDGVEARKAITRYWLRDLLPFQDREKKILRLGS